MSKTLPARLVIVAGLVTTAVLCGAAVQAQTSAPAAATASGGWVVDAARTSTRVATATVRL